jgi:CBS domain-containing protein
MQAGDVMSKRVVSVRPDASILEAGELMLKHDISGLPVVDAQGRLVGIVTERDFLRPARRNSKYRRPRWLEVVTGRAPMISGEAEPSARKIADVMTVNPVTVTASTPLEECVRCMDKHEVKRLPVVEEGRLVGIIARADLIRALVQSLRKEREELRRMTEVERQSWLHRTRP